MRARSPDETGTVVRDGIRLVYEIHGEGDLTVLLMPTWSIVHSRIWKNQIPFLARHVRVVTFDGRGNGRSDRPTDPEAYRPQQFVDDALAVLDTTGTDQAVLVGLSRGGYWSALLAAQHPERVLGAFLVAPSAPLAPDGAEPKAQTSRPPPDYLRDHYPDFAARFMRGCFPEAHSSKAIEDGVAWALESSGAVIAATEEGAQVRSEEAEAVFAAVRCPVRVLHGTDDRIVPAGVWERIEQITGARRIVVDGAGHVPNARYPAIVDLHLRDFLEEIGGRPLRPRPVARSASRKVLYLSSPIGLGHVRRDLAIVQALRERHPDLEVDWLSQSPVTEVLRAAGERVHPASDRMACESQHLEEHSGEHDLNCFQALRDMDEVLVSNFLLFQDVLESERHDLVVADEAWDVDHFWHEHPELKRAPLAWMTDFVGFLPMPGGGSREERLVADWNLERIERVEAHRLRDRSIFVGGPDDVVDRPFGPGLPSIRDWTHRHFQFAGYVAGFDPRSLDRQALRAELGWRDDETVCVVTVGGSGVGGHLLRRVLEAFPEARRRVPGLRMFAVAGPRIDPTTLPRAEGLEVHGYVDRLYRHLAACDVAVVQGGLTTTMELAASRVPFLYFPLRNHFEQNVHVRHRLERYGAGRCMRWEDAVPEVIAQALVDELARPVAWQEVERHGAARAAALLSELL